MANFNKWTVAQKKAKSDAMKASWVLRRRKQRHSLSTQDRQPSFGQNMQVGELKITVRIFTEIEG